MKKIIAVAMVKNESDVIESFCRHTLTFCDAILICDDKSVDSTPDIINKLAAEGLSVHLFGKQYTRDYAQLSVVNELARVAVDTYEADLILPLDADEFLTLPASGGGELPSGRRLKTYPMTIYTVRLGYILSLRCLSGKIMFFCLSILGNIAPIRKMTRQAAALTRSLFPRAL